MTMTRAICATRYQRLAGDESLAFCGLDDHCVEDGHCDSCDYKELLCPNCGEGLAYFSGLERIPEYLYCPGVGRVKMRPEPYDVKMDRMACDYDTSMGYLMWGVNYANKMERETGIREP